MFIHMFALPHVCIHLAENVLPTEETLIHHQQEPGGVWQRRSRPTADVNQTLTRRNDWGRLFLNNGTHTRLIIDFALGILY